MGYKSLIAKQVKAAMRTLGTDADGLARENTYVWVDPTGNVYNPSTRSMTEVVQTIPNVPMVLARFTVDDMPSDVKPRTDRKALIAALDLSVVPGEQDRIVTPDGDVYTVHKLLSDPADALHILHIRMREAGA